MPERESTPPAPILDAERIAQALGAELKRSSSNEPELTLEDSASGLHLRLTLHPERDAVSLYVRVGRHFGGFLHLAGVEKVELKPEQREVDFVVSFGKRLCQFGVTGQGQVLALGNIEQKETPSELETRRRGGT